MKDKLIELYYELVQGIKDFIKAWNASLTATAKKL